LTDATNVLIVLSIAVKRALYATSMAADEEAAVDAVGSPGDNDVEEDNDDDDNDEEVPLRFKSWN